MRFAVNSRINARMHTQPGKHWAKAKKVSADTVPADAQCPQCHENRMDWLVWTDDDTLTCATCGYEYTV